LASEIGISIMLPNKMKITESATNSLKRYQGNVGLTVNIGARLSFFISLERGYRFRPEIETIEHDGRELDKHTWLGPNYELVQMLLKQTYPKFNKFQIYNAWAAHVLDGAKILETKKSTPSLLNN